MSDRQPYYYAVLRYIHDTVTGEFVNVGLAMFSEHGAFLRFKTKPTLGHITSMFPSLNAVAFKGLLNMLKTRFKLIDAEVKYQHEFANKNTTLDRLLLQVLPKDDSALVWSPISNGVSADLSATFDKVIARHITKFDQKSSRKNRTDEDVWRQFRRDLEKRNLLSFFGKKSILGADDEMEFPFAWKNGIWHCIEPISFDLTAPESIKDKAHKWLGQVTSVMDSSEKFKVYFLLAKPSHESLNGAFEKAITILQKAPVTSEIYLEGNMDNLVDKLQEQVDTHY